MVSYILYDAKSMLMVFVKNFEHGRQISRNLVVYCGWINESSGRSPTIEESLSCYLASVPESQK